MSRTLLALGLILVSQSALAIGNEGKRASCALTRVPHDYAKDKMIDTTDVGFVDAMVDDPIGLLTEDGKYAVVVDSILSGPSEKTKKIESKISVRVYYKKQLLLDTYANAETDGKLSVRAQIPDPENVGVTRAQIPVLLQLICKIEAKN